MKFLLLVIIPFSLFGQNFTAAEISHWQQQARHVNIIRDQWGIPHIYGKTDADAVFGLLYAQCEDDFPRVELNYIEKLGRMAELQGVAALPGDLLNRLLIDSADAISDYQRAPRWLRRLCNAFADGINYYIYTHPQQKRLLLSRFEPWYPLLWTDGSIGAINTADIRMNEWASLYLGDETKSYSYYKAPAEVADPGGSNGFAFSPKITASGNAILYINPHVTFYFRPEVHMVSEEGLNAYGAVTWGQFFIYQGFNEHCGWMHTSSYADAADSYIEKLSPNENGFTYLYEGKQMPVREKPIILKYKSAAGIQKKTVNALYTDHGPIMAQRNGAYLSLRADNRLLNGLIQCWQRTKARNFEEYKKTMALFGNISNNTVYADADGNIAYWHGNRIPRRDTSYDWSKPVDGSIAATQWKGLHSVEETVHLYNPSNGWLQNCNSTPFTVAGNESPKRNLYPAYMAPDGENFRGINAVRVLQEGSEYTIDKVISAGYDRRLAAFEVLIPALVEAFEKTVQPSDSLFAYLAGPIAVLKSWDKKASESSIALTLAVTWGEKIIPAIYQLKPAEGMGSDQVSLTRQFAATADSAALLDPLMDAIRELTARYGRWQIPWGSINRFQRISGKVENVFDDKAASIPVGFASSLWGMLPSYNSKIYPDTRNRYGVNGNSFICAVEFGKKITAKSLLAGGESGHPHSTHFFDQGENYAKGIFKEVYFYKEDVMKHAASNYHPGKAASERQ